MNNINTLSKKAFVLEHLFYILVSFIWYRGLLFRNIAFRSRAESLFILWTLILVLNAIGMALNWRLRRNCLTLFSDICIPLGIYTFISYPHYSPVLRIAVLLAGGIFSAVYCGGVLSRGIAKKRYVYIKEIIKRRVWRCLLGMRTILAICLAVLMLPLCVNVLFGNTLASSNIHAERPIESNLWTVENHMETVLNLRETTWNNLSAKERMNTLQTISNIEANYLGLPHELTVTVGLLDETTIAGYADSDHSIKINVDCFDTYSAADILNATCHEVYHAYQHRLCDAYDSVDTQFRNLLAFQNAEAYKYEFANYTDGDDDFQGYYRQTCEQAARKYAREAVDAYYAKIDEHVTSTGQAITTTQKEDTP